MGLTHYWYIKGDIEEPVFSRICSDIDILFTKAKNELGIVMADAMGDTAEPVLGPDSIAFNGLKSEGYETFLVSRVAPGHGITDPEGRRFGFCKTALKRYDIIVRAVLIILKRNLKDDILVMSDDKNHSLAWQDARMMVEKMLGYASAADFVLDKSPKL